MSVLGTNVVLSFLKDESYQPFICATECSIEIETELKDVRGPNSGKWKKKRGQSLSYRVSLSGLIELVGGDPRTFWLVDNQIMMLSIPFRMVFEESDLLKIASGTAIIRVSQLTSSSTSFANSSFDFEGDGELVLADSATLCEGTIGSLSYSAGDNPGELDVQYEDVVVYDGGRLEYSVDEGGRVPVFSPGSSGEFTITGLTEGDHTITVWAVCESGVDGESNSFSFHIDEGGDPGVGCNAPSDISFSAITSTSFTATWVAATPTPADGYYWELINYDLGTTIDTGSTAGTSENFTGLTAGITYQIRVRSVCTTGTSQSAYTSAFITLAAACNTPGTPSITAITETTATATWTAPSPAPVDGYFWELLQGVTVIDSGATPLLTVDLTGLSSGTTYSFRVKSICDVGNVESGFNTTVFATIGVDNNIAWEWIEDEGDGTFVIRVNGVDVVNEAAAGAGNFICAAGDNIQAFLSATTGHIVVTDLTTSTVIEDESAGGVTIAVFTTISGHSYSIFAEVIM